MSSARPTGGEWGCLRTRQSENDGDSEHEGDSESGGPSNGDIMKVLLTMQEQLNKKLDSLNNAVDVLKGEVFDLQQDNQQLKTQLGQCKKREEEMQRRIDETAFTAKLAAERSNRNEQYSRRNNIKILFVGETSNTFESAEESEKKALTVFHDKLGLRNINADHIEAAHRVGVKQAGRIRPLLVRFLSRKTKFDVIKNRRKLKNSGIVIVEDLTKSIYTLFRNASDHPGTLRAWTSDGKIFVQDMNFKTHKIETTSDLSKLSFDADDPETAEGAVRKRLTSRRQQHRWSDRQQAGKRGDDVTGPTTPQVMEADQTRSKPQTAGGDQ